MDGIATMKKQVEKLDEYAEILDMFGGDAGDIDPSQLIGEDGNPINIKPAKTKVCRSF